MKTVLHEDRNKIKRGRERANRKENAKGRQILYSMN